MQQDDSLPTGLKHTIDLLWKECGGDSTLHARLEHLVTVGLVRDMNNYRSQIKQKEQKKDMLSKSFTDFAEDFLNQHPYYYLPGSSLFIQYDDLNFTIIEEDDIQHRLYTKINHIQEFADHKTKLKTHVIRKIKERLLIDTTPESETIQKTIAIFHPFVFPSKREAQYFLTAIGDNILRKHDNIVHIVDGSAKQMMTLLSEQFCSFLGNSVALNSFKFKYYDQSYSTTRLLTTNSRIYLPDIWRQSLPADFLNIIAVACHYSDRFKSSDGFLEKMCQDTPQRHHTHFLSDNTPETIVAKFKAEMISDSTTSESRITQKNMLYLWKAFLCMNNLPSIMFVNTFKNEIKKITEFDQESESFIKVTSKHLPLVGSFIDFWTAHVTTDTHDGLDELEVEELCSLFKASSERAGVPGSFTDQEILSLIQHYYPDVEIKKNRIVSGIKCDAWDKQSCIGEFMTEHKGSNGTSRVTLNKLYRLYCKSQVGKALICNKEYFERVIRERFKDNVISKCSLKEGW